MIYYKKLQNLIRKEGIPAMKETLARIQQTLDYIEDNPSDGRESYQAALQEGHRKEAYSDKGSLQGEEKTQI